MKSLRITLILALILAWLAPGNSRAEPAAPTNPNAPAKERFLVLVETSAAMQKRAENTQKALGSVIANGLKGHIEPGSTIGLWTFNETLFTGQVPLQLWTPETRQHVALTLVQVLQQQKYEKTARLGSAWGVATNIVAQSERITLLLFTSGSEPIQGTPFDASIAESFTKNVAQQRKANLPFVTILRAVNGKFVAFAVNMPPWPLDVPEWPDEFKPQPASIIPEAKSAPVAGDPPPGGKRIDPTVLSPTNTIYLVEPTPVTETPATSTTPPATNAIAALLRPVVPLHTNASVPTTATETKPSSGSKLKVTPKPASPEPAATTKPKLTVVTLLIVGICVLLGIMLVFIILLRGSRRAAGESLITRSMNQKER